jgi:hypothetical protein
MKRFFFIVLLFCFAQFAWTQSVFRTIVSQQPVVAGESFAVQYVLEDREKEEAFTAPPFTGLRLVTGPDYYGGITYGIDGAVPLKNIVYTLVAPRPGWITIPGATIKLNGKTIKSNDVLVEVIDKKDLHKRSNKGSKEASEYFLKPGENPQEKIRKNLFVRVTVNKKNCYVGQPVLATFKLYSRLESRSDIVKNPGFYGFTVHDVLNLNDKHSVTEVIDGKIFDVHTIRMVQLYPLQAGRFVIDPMEVTNKVEFSRSVIKRKTEQKIKEGVFEDDEPITKINAVSFENTISTVPITIDVTALPESNKPATFNGATGNFSINAAIEEEKIARNEQGNLLVTLRGEGNFIQLNAPAIIWPEGVEGFSPEIIDSLDKSHTPLKGIRTFKFPFVASKGGRFAIPAVSFSFFDPDTNRYKTVSTPTIDFVIDNKEKLAEAVIEQQPGIVKNKPSRLLVMVGALAIIATIVFLIQHFTNKKKRVKESVQEEKKQTTISLDDELQAAFDALRINDPGFYTILQKTTWNYLGKALNISGSMMNKDDLQRILSARKVNQEIQTEFFNLLNQCEIASFTQAELSISKKSMLFRIKELLRSMKLQN